MTNRTYRYFKGDVLYPFGYGLSYTSFKYKKLEIPAQIQTGDSVRVQVTVSNTGKRAGEEVVQIYLSHKEIAPEAPNCQLVAFKKVKLDAGETQTISFMLAPRSLAYVEDAGGVTEPDGTVTFYAGNVCPSAPQRFTSQVLSKKVQLTGNPRYFMY